jgi:hypothetical protein
MTGTHYQAQIFSVEMGTQQTFSPGWPGTANLSNLNLANNRIMGVHHWSPALICTCFIWQY